MRIRRSALLGLGATLIVASMSPSVRTHAAPPTIAPPAPGSAGQLVVATTAAAPTLDPTLSTATSSIEITLHVFDSLVTYDEHYRIVPDLATAWTISKDKVSYTFHVAPHIKFHNGQSMTSADVVASIQRAMKVGHIGRLAQLTYAAWMGG